MAEQIQTPMQTSYVVFSEPPSRSESALESIVAELKAIKAELKEINTKWPIKIEMRSEGAGGAGK